MKYVVLKYAVFSLLIVMATFARGAELSPEARLRQLMEVFDPFDRLRVVPMEDRPAEAIMTSLDFVKVKAKREVTSLGNKSSGDKVDAAVLEDQGPHLRVTAKMVAEAINNASSIDDEFKPELKPDARAKLEELHQIVEAFESKSRGFDEADYYALFVVIFKIEAVVSQE